MRRSSSRFLPQTEVYGQPFPETVLVSNTNPAPTGTITFSLGKQILCTLTTTLTPTTICNAPNSWPLRRHLHRHLCLHGRQQLCSRERHCHSHRHPGAAHRHRQQRLPSLWSAQPNLDRHAHWRSPGRHRPRSRTPPPQPSPAPLATTQSSRPSPRRAAPTLSNYTVTNNPGTLTITQAP